MHSDACCKSWHRKAGSHLVDFSLEGKCLGLRHRAHWCMRAIECFSVQIKRREVENVWICACAVRKSIGTAMFLEDPHDEVSLRLGGA